MLSGKQKRAIEILLENPTIKRADLAAQLNVTPTTISNWMKNKEFTETWDAEVDKHWSDLGRKAKKRLEELMDSSNPSVAVSAVKTYLDKCLPNKTAVDVNGDVGINIRVDVD